MLDKLRNAIAGGDATTLMSIATEGKSLEERANTLKSMGATIKKNAGIS